MHLNVVFESPQSQVTKVTGYFVMAKLLRSPTSVLVIKVNPFGKGVNAPVFASTE
jgi:hypothetical protein